MIRTKLRPIIRTLFRNKFLLCANIGISLILAGFGDILEQKYEIMLHELNDWDKTRTKNMALCGCSSGIVCHYWYDYLDYKIPGRSFKAVTKKVLADQIFCSPVTITLFFVTLGILENKTLLEFRDEVVKKFWTLYVAEWVLWPSAQFLNFYILPLRYRVLYDNTISLLYDVYMSHVLYDPMPLQVDLLETKATKN